MALGAQRETGGTLPDGYQRMPFQEVRRWFSRSHDDRKAYAEALTQEPLDAEGSAFNPRENKEYHWPSWQLASHLTAVVKTLMRAPRV